MKALTASLIATSLIGCMPAHLSTTYVRPDTTPEQTHQDSEACAKWAYSTTIGLYLWWSLADAVNTKAQTCMAGKGYRWEVAQ